MLREFEHVAAGQRVCENNRIDLVVFNHPLQIFKPTWPDRVRVVDALSSLDQRPDYRVTYIFGHLPRLLR